MIGLKNCIYPRGDMDRKWNLKLIICLITVISTLLLLTLPVSVAAQESEKIIIAVHNYPPYYNQKGQGMMTEIYRAVFGRVGINAVIQTYPIKRGIAFLFENHVDAFSPGHILLTPEDQGKAVWENSFIVAMVMIYYKPHMKEPFHYSSLEDLRGKKVAGLVNSPYIEEYKKHGVILYPVETPQQMIRMVRRGYVDFYVNTLLSGLIQIKNEFPDEVENFDYFVWDQLECSLAFNRSGPKTDKYLTAFKKGLDQVKKDGTYIRLMEQYWGHGNVPKSVLFKDLHDQGTDRVDVKKFNFPARTEWGRISE